ncbi:2-oxo-4-hydroxy-4-carboxy-5-ureidoimidazoline decarboxylase [Acerihabitans arboris]|uniref:2-oxo-4-hydroxy-4-carboxy-5-ureidoimidazoline decarboxylase n=1 Tax=Acerihabitans arboris TaxID=2691583 RepID=UPI00248457C4|nr:2-oxo-4-hydroxy-4-carboxy-5-ureidoimidazoline decarboxylase [Acerihabitans arboris]
MAPPETAAAMLLACAAIPEWSWDIIAARPFASADSLIEYAGALALRWRAKQVSNALARHPRIGERPVGHGADAGHSRREQSAVDPADARLAADLLEGNRRYEQRFGQVFLIHAAGRGGHDILARLRQRLEHSPEQEQRETALQLRKIALSRLQQELAPC